MELDLLMKKKKIIEESKRLTRLQILLSDVNCPLTNDMAKDIYMALHYVNGVIATHLEEQGFTKEDASDPCKAALRAIGEEV